MVVVILFAIFAIFIAPVLFVNIFEAILETI